VEHGPGAELGVLDTPAARLRLAAPVPAGPADVAVTAGDNLGTAEVAGQRRPTALQPDLALPQLNVVSVVHLAKADRRQPAHR